MIKLPEPDSSYFKTPFPDIEGCIIIKPGAAPQILDGLQTIVLTCLPSDAILVEMAMLPQVDLDLNQEYAFNWGFQ